METPPFVRYLFVLILLFWFIEFVGYMWHRHVTHLGALGDQIRATHYCHHEEVYPYYDMESVKYHTAHDTWPWYLPAIVAFTVIILVWRWGWLGTAMFAFVIIYICVHAYTISYVHDSYHIKGHWLNNFHWYRENKRRHHLHHLQNCNYGITIYTFDKLCGTYQDDFPKPKEDIFNGLKSGCNKRVKALDFLG